jgi:hypothetical protein
MFPRRRAPGVAESNAVDASERMNQAAARQQQTQLQNWRRSAQRVTRAWNAVLAADGGERSARYRDYVSALAEEQREAEEVQRVCPRSVTRRSS